MPLTVCDPSTVSMSDAVPTALYGFSKTGLPTSQLSLKAKEENKWYYYPDMRNDEVLVFKQFEFFKGVDDQEDATFKTCFHTAFKHPDAPYCVEKRKSCEHRVSVFFD